MILNKNIIDFSKDIEPFSKQTQKVLWNDPYISKQMLNFHLDPNVDAASRNMDFINKSVDWIINRFKLSHTSRICDFGCGPGLYTSKFAKRNIEVTGIDFSKNSIEYAKKYAKGNDLDIQYINDNYLNIKIDNEYDLVTMIYCDYCALDRESREKLLSNVKNGLNKDGLFLFDVHSKTFYDNYSESKTWDYTEHNGFFSKESHLTINQRKKYDNLTTLEKYLIIEDDRHFEIYNWLKCFSLEEITNELAINGFEVIEVYSDVAGSEYNSSSEIITLVCKKK